MSILMMISFLKIICPVLLNILKLIHNYDTEFPKLKNTASCSERANYTDEEFKTPLIMVRIVKYNGNPIVTSNIFYSPSNNNDANVAERTTETNDSNGDIFMGVQPTVKGLRLQPFYVKVTTNSRDLDNKIDEISDCKFFKTTQDNFIIFFNSIDVYRKIQSYLINYTIEFFGLKPKTERPRNILIKVFPQTRLFLKSNQN